MQVTSLTLSGFKYFDVNTQINFKEKNNHLLSNKDSDQKYYLFEAILGVLYGLTSEEKINFRDLDSSVQTFTGMLTVEFSNRTMLIERDFETDFVACLISTPKAVRPFYQGKDFILNSTPRPYLKVLEEFLSVIEKDIILELCYDADANDPQNLYGLLNTLYILLAPQLKIKDAMALIQPEKLDDKFLEMPPKDAAIDAHIDFLMKKRNFLTDLMIIGSKMNEIKYNLEQLQSLINSVQHKGKERHSLTEELKRRFPEVHQENALELRADVLAWKSLKQKKIEKEIELENINNRIKQVKRLIHSDYAAYKNVPETFESDFDKFGKLKSELSEKRRDAYEAGQKLKRSENKLKRKKQKRWLLLLSVPAIVFMISLFIFGPMWILIIPETVIIILAVLLYFGHVNESIRAEIFHINEEKRLIEIRMQEIESEIRHIFMNNPLFKDEEYLIIHLDRFKKYSKYQTELHELKKKEAAVYEELHSERLTKQLRDYEDKYSEKINIDRFDIEDYLDRFVEAQREAQNEEAEMSRYPGVEMVSAIKRKYLVTLDNLKTFRDKACRQFKIDAGQTETEIGNISNKIRKLESSFKDQQIDPAKISGIV